MNDETPKTQNSPNPPNPGTPPLSPSGPPRPLAIRIFGWIGVVLGGIVLAFYIGQRVNGNSPGILELVFGLLLMIGGFSMTRSSRTS